MMSLRLRGACVLTILVFAISPYGTAANAGGTNACCMATGECLSGTQNDSVCSDAGGTSFIANTDCDPNPCPQPGACCDASGCFESLESGCSASFFEGETCPSTSCCGDGTCAADEDSCSCPDDCPDDPNSCSACECGGQSSGGCWCDTACHRLGDCCADICDACPCCGDGTCQIEEDQCSCAGDCPDPNPFLCDPCECGDSSSDGTCYCDDICVISGDCCSNACDECGFCSFCGDGTCSIDEDCSTCPEDCLVCGDGFCDFPCEDNCSCPEDCSACGDAFCDTLCEDCNNCPDDCVCGACCTGPDNCQVTLEADCSGEYQGDGTFCDVDTCALPTGACCIDNQACSEAPADQCNAGTYQGDGTTCSPDPCERQCCFEDGGCQRLPEADCISQGGTPGDPGSDCSPNTCPQPPVGACCLTVGGCADSTSQPVCAQVAGVFAGEGTVCADGVCPGTCCLIDGSCIQATSADCTAQGGDPAPLQECAVCPAAFACCFSDGSCETLTFDACAERGGSSDAAGDCSSVSCPQPTGACITAGGECTETTQAECFDNSGTFLGTGTSCGACCMTDGSCMETTEADCTGSFAGTYQGDDTFCVGVTCPGPTGACCSPIGQCAEVVEADCALPQEYQGDGTTCETGACSGACCAFLGGCVVGSTPFGCGVGGGSFQGFGSTCTPDPCPITTGACCLSAGGCMETTFIGCLGVGSYQGDGINCDPDPCPAGPVCGDGNCEIGEDCTTCLPDCPCGACETCVAGSCNTNCGDGTCDPACGECTGCFQDCQAACEDNVCSPLCENCDNCFADCSDTCTGACCFSGSCSELTEAGCSDAGGFYEGVNTTCDSDTCQPEACCFFNLGGRQAAGISVGDCEPRLSTDCMNAGGIPQGAGSVCDPNPCVAPCCFVDGSCSILNPEVCFTMGGITQPPDGTCDPNTCPAPPCCLSDGGCEHIPVADCVANGGTPRSPAELCALISCAAMGACCYEGKGTGCVEVTADECASIFQGDFQGDNTVCTPDPCPASNECDNQPVGAACGADDNNACTTVCTPDGVCGIDCDDNNACTTDSCDPGSGCQHAPIDCEDFDLCTVDRCDPVTGCSHEPVCGACCLNELNGNVAGPLASGCIDAQAVTCEKGFGGEFLGAGTSCETSTCNPNRADISTKGSLLIFSDVELEWRPGGPGPSPIAGPAPFGLTRDTVISLVNDYPGEVYVQMYFINGDSELDPLFVGTPPTLVRDGEPGCNWVDCQLLLTPDQSIYWSAATGSPAGCQPFDILDPDLGSGPGRPNPDAADGSRVLRGYVVAWAVDEFGREVNWNHLSGKATIVDYAAQTAWEYEPWAFQAQENLHGEVLPQPGVLQLDGVEYDQAFDMLLYDFFAAGSQAFSSDGSTVTLDGELTLHPVTHDLRQEHDEPVTTKAHFDIWNMNERKLSNTRRCLTCWDQALLSTFNAPNSFLLANLQSDKGKARIDGKQADECEENCFRDPMGNPLPVEDLLGLLGDLFGDVDVVCSQDAALLGVATKILTFSGPAGQRAVAGSPLVGMGFEPAVIQYDIIDPPGTLREDAFQRIGRSLPRAHDRLDTEAKKQRN